jgi:hypothetical protein
MENEEFDILSAYEELCKRYDLPEFNKLAEDFDIEKVAEKEPGFLAREIRRMINEKLSVYLHLFETLINPAAPPLFVFSLLRNLDGKSKDKIRDIYKIISRLQIEVMKIDTIYSEEKEVAFIKESFDLWQKLKPQIYELIEDFEKDFEKDSGSKKSAYFG